MRYNFIIGESKPEELTSMRKCGYEGVDEFLWITEDQGAFGNETDGPLFDWIQGRDDFLLHVKNKNVVITAGGNCGMYVRFYKNYFRDVYTFEPDDLCFYCLDRNCVGEGYHKYHGGLGETTDKLTLVKTFAPSNHGMHQISKTPGNVQMYRIDDLNLNACDLIHLDVEGFEADALRGGLETIKKFKPVIILERANGKDVIEPLGYKMIKELRMDSIFVCEE
jgi:FkbM family methyltransferase